MSGTETFDIATCTAKFLLEFAPYRELLRRKRRRMQKKALGIKAGSGYEIRGGVKRRIDPRRQQMLKRRGREMARKASQQVKMRIGRRRAASVIGGKASPQVRTKKLRKTPSEATVARFEADGRWAYCHAPSHLLRMVDVAREGKLEEALAMLAADPRYRLTSYGLLSDHLLRECQTKEIDGIIDVETVDDEALAVYQEGKADPEAIRDLLEEYGDVSIVAKADTPIATSEKTHFNIVMLIPSEKTLSQFEPKETVETVTSVGVGGFKDVGTNTPPMVSTGYGGDVSHAPTRQDLQVDFRLGMPQTDKEYKKAQREVKKRLKAAFDTAKRMRSHPLGINPDIGTQAAGSLRSTTY